MKLVFLVYIFVFYYNLNIVSYCFNVLFLKFWIIFFYLFVFWNWLYFFDRVILRLIFGSYCYIVDCFVLNENFKSFWLYWRFVVEVMRDLWSRCFIDCVLLRLFLFGVCGCYFEKWFFKILNKYCCYFV